MPSVTQVHIDVPLTNVSLFYQNGAYVADHLAPTVPVRRESDKYYVYGKENFRLPPTQRADKAETRELTWSLGTDMYFCEEYGLHALVSDRERGNADSVLSLDSDTTVYITECLHLDREFRVANQIVDPTNEEWGDYADTHFTNLAYAWDDPTGADVRRDIYFGRWVIFRDARKQPTDIYLPTEVSYRILQTDQFDELRKYTDPNLVVNSGLPKKIFGLAVNECESTYATSVEGASEDTFAETWGNNVVMAYRNPAKVGIRTLTFAVTFQNQAFQTVKWREAPRKADVIEVSHRWDTKIVAPACGFVFTNPIEPTS